MTATSLDLGVLEDLAFEPALPCEHSQHEEKYGPGELIVLLVPCCEVCPTQLVMCVTCYGPPDAWLECTHCGQVAPKHEWWRVIGHVKDWK